ncbi:MAG: J domain-containing protein [Desulfuromonadaceae bacterium]|nr:J domain-containing protein [Desulfuromonadaceae bacterium]MDD5105758.1 J domain-containing protein [Desulfuromonadaceae bacterium]
MTYLQLQEARQILGLRERMTINEIKVRHRKLVKEYHPDAGNCADQNKIKAINEAYRIVLDYVAEYQLSFTEGEFYEQNPDERLRQQFMDVPMWGKR